MCRKSRSCLCNLKVSQFGFFVNCSCGLGRIGIRSVNLQLLQTHHVFRSGANSWATQDTSSTSVFRTPKRKLGDLANMLLTSPLSKRNFFLRIYQKSLKAYESISLPSMLPHHGFLGCVGTSLIFPSSDDIEVGELQLLNFVEREQIGSIPKLLSDGLLSQFVVVKLLCNSKGGFLPLRCWFRTETFENFHWARSARLSKWGRRCELLH